MRTEQLCGKREREKDKTEKNKLFSSFFFFLLFFVLSHLYLFLLVPCPDGFFVLVFSRRCSQPRVGLRSHRSQMDEMYLREISKTNPNGIRVREKDKRFLKDL